LIESSRDAAQRLLGASARLIVHGGGADGLVPRLPGAIRIPNLVLEGLAIWAAVDANDG
jgi:type III pantothenate kinase